MQKDQMFRSVSRYLLSITGVVIGSALLAGLFILATPGHAWGDSPGDSGPAFVFVILAAGFLCALTMAATGAVKALNRLPNAMEECTSESRVPAVISAILFILTVGLCVASIAKFQAMLSGY